MRARTVKQTSPASALPATPCGFPFYHCDASYFISSDTNILITELLKSFSDEILSDIALLENKSVCKNE